MALWWGATIFCRSAAVWFPLLLSSLLWQTICPVHAVPSCPRSCSCPGVKEVHCTFRHLLTIPKTFPKDTERINLGYNSLTEVEGSEFRSLRQLEMLMLHGNDISTVHPGAFYSLRSLQILKLSYNKLTSVSPGLFEGLASLIRLHLDHNLIHFIEPYSFSGLTSLKLLQLEGNLLKEIHPHTFITVSLLGAFWTSGLRHLHLSDNLLEQLPAAALQTAARLEILSLHGNPWTCDCQLHWLVEWSSKHEGVIKCKKERDPGSSETCPRCSSPQPLNGSLFLGLTPDELPCERPALRSPLKQSDSPVWPESDAEPDLPYTRDLERPLGHLTFVLSDSHGNNAHVACDVRRPGDSSPMTWTEIPRSPREVSVNVSLVTVLECEIDREALQNLWRLVAYYHESPATLERGLQKGNATRVTYQYAQALNENSPYFTDLKGYLVAEPSWLLQPKVTLKLNRHQTTTKKLVMDFTTVISQQINNRGGREDDNDGIASSWALIRRRTAGRVQSTLEGSKVHLDCDVIASGSEVKAEWMLPDLSIVESPTDKIQISETGGLVILNSTVSDSGLYHCMVRTKAGVDLVPVRLTVKERSLSPTAFNGQKMIVEKGRSLVLPCEVTSAEPSQTIWYLPKNQSLLPTQQTRRAEVMGNGTLVVKKVTQEDTGEYSCMVSNLYGVDMLSHIVEVTGEKEPDRSNVQTERGRAILLVGGEEVEGSGVDYQEIKRPFATQSPKTLGTRQRNPGGKRLKDSKRKPNKSVKELDPNRWAEILAKANTRANTAPPTVQSQTELSTKTTAMAKTSTPNPPTTTTTTTPTATTTDSPHTTRLDVTTESSQQEVLQPPLRGPAVPRSKEPSVHRGGGIAEKPDSVTAQTPQPITESENRSTGEGRRNSKLSPGWSNRRGPPFRRRRPPMRRVHPHLSPSHPSANKPQSTLRKPTTTTATTTTTTTTTTMMTTTTTTAPTTEEDEGDEEYYYDDKDGDRLDAKGNLNGETLHPTRDSDGIRTTTTPERENDPEVISSPSGRHHLPHPKTIPAPKPDSVPHPTETSVEEEEEDSDEGRRGEIGKEEEGKTEREKKSNGKKKINRRRNQKQSLRPPRTPEWTRFTPGSTISRPPPGPQTHTEREGRKKRQKKGKEEGKRWKSSFLASPRPPTGLHTVTSIISITPSTLPGPVKGPGLHPVPTLRPWLLPHLRAQGSGVTNRPGITAETVKPTPVVSESSGNSRIAPTAPHTSHHHHHHHHAGGGGSGTQTRDQLLLLKLRNRYRQAQLDRIAQLGRRVTPKPRYHHPPSFNTPRPPPRYHHPPSSNTPKPPPRYQHPPSSNTPRPILPLVYKPQTPKPAAPTTSHTYTLKPPKPAKPSSSSSSGLFPTSPPRPLHTTVAAVYGGRWPFEGRISSRRPTAAPPFPGLMGVGGGGVKPRITTVTMASVSVLAESDVFLPCEASGRPEPNLAWTKVSTGATIPANTKYGLRFEVFKNGTFVIRNVQLQDRGQYLCTAQNRFGSDRLVITLAVQTQAPRILPPKSTDVTVYLGKSVGLDCLASGKPPAHVSWILPDRTFVREVGPAHAHISPVSLLPNGTLQIHSANFSRKGHYKCIASNAAGADTVTYHLHVAALPPSISEGALDTVIIQPGRSVYVHCSAKGEPEPMLKWTLPAGVHVKPSQFLGRRLFVFPNGTLYMRNVSPADAGRYDCLASNAVGIAKRTLHLEVKADLPSPPRQPPPPPPIPPSNRHAVPRPSRQHTVSAMYGSTVYLHCPESIGSTRGTIWQLPSKTVMEHRYSPERPITVFPNGTLRILQLTELDGGNYLCAFQRPNGEDMELFQVEVLMTPPRIEHLRTAQTRVTFGEKFQMDCVATGLPDPEVSWSLPDGTFINNALQSDDSGVRNRRYVIFGNGTLLLQQMGKRDEGDYTCYAKNKLGKDERKVSVKVGPDAPKIRSKSQSLVAARLGDPATLSCQAVGEPTPRIMWISPGNVVMLVSSDRYQILDDGVLVVRKVTLADEGKYTCVARNSAGDDVKHMRLEVESQEPRIHGAKGKSTTKVLAVSYQTTLLHCRAEGKPAPRISWVTPYGHSLPTPHLGGRFQVHRNGSLELRGVRRTDEGRYTCLAKNHLGEASLVVDLEVVPIAEKPSFAVPNIEILPIKPDSGEVTLECPARGKPHPEFAWVLPNGTVLAPGVRLHRFTHHLGNGTLRISQSVASDKGVYRCVAKNVAGQAEKRYSLEEGRKPLIRGSTGGMKITYGHSLNLPCSVDGWPPASIAWTLPNGLILDKPQTVGRVSLLANGTLRLREVATFDKGTYICKASNSFGSSTLSYPVAVMVFPPRVTNSLPSITRISRGEPVTLDCVAAGIPKPDISWTLPGRTTLVPHNRFTVQGGIHMTEEGSLVIQNPVLMNSGIYKCNAKNALGTDFRSTYLQVV
ncbi:matrix-remodeling-associated protein 5 [Diretmus argenteus]